MKTALITGITGQDGSYLTDLLLEKDYIIHGIVRRKSVEEISNLDHIPAYSKKDHLHLHFADLTDACSIRTVLSKIRPDEIYNLAAQSHVGISFEIPEYTADVCGVGVIRMLESMRQVCPDSKFYQASSSEMFGGVTKGSLNEESPFNPKSPYDCSKVLAHNVVVNYRNSYNMFAVSGILFNHESPRRGKQFVTRKITYNLAKIKLGLADKFSLGNLDSKRDWGYSKDYVEAM